MLRFPYLQQNCAQMQQDTENPEYNNNDKNDRNPGYPQASSTIDGYYFQHLQPKENDDDKRIPSLLLYLSFGPFL